MKVIDTLRSGRYREQDKFLPWVMRIAYNLCIDHFRRNKRMPIVTTGDGYDIFDVLGFKDKSIEENLIHDNTYDKVRNLVNHLPERAASGTHIASLFRYEFQGDSRYDRVSINTALGRMRYALINIRKMMAEKISAYDTIGRKKTVRLRVYWIK